MNTYEAYAILDAQIKDLELRKETMRVEILKGMVEAGEDKIETPVGSFSVAKLKRWTYSDAVTEANEAWKAMKAKEESCGIATYVEQESLKFNSIKL